ncbi:tetratricopeptide repeat protein [Rhodovibrionaceae bacterium A322]
MAFSDLRGLQLTAASGETLTSFEKALDGYLGTYGDPVALLDDLLQEDPGFIMGHCLHAALHLLAFERDALVSVADSLEKLEDLEETANDSEQAHIAALRTFYAGDLRGAVDHWEKALLLNPRDLMALRLCHDLAFFLGDRLNLRDTVGRVRATWSPDLPGYGYLVGMHAFGLEECGDYARAEEAGRQALEINAKDSWAVHAVAHVMEMMGRQDDGIAWLTSREADWTDDNFFAVHNWWHLALYHLDLGQMDKVMALYDGPIRGDKSQTPLDLVDASALLWRLELLNDPAGQSRWPEVIESWDSYAHDGVYGFNDWHVMMGLAATKRFSEAEALLKAMTSAANGPDSTYKTGLVHLGLTACKGFLAFGQGRYKEAAELLLPIRHRAADFGGSHAQRDILSWTALEALLRDGQFNLASALINERCELKPSSPQNRTLATRASGAISH